MGGNSRLKKLSILLTLWVCCCGCALHGLTKESYEQLIADQLAEGAAIQPIDKEKILSKKPLIQ